MKIKKFILVIAFYCDSGRAEWLCREASSKAMDNVFYACGHALSDSLIGARENSLAAAKREFEAFCKESSNCKGQAYTLSPLRTDCTKVADKYSCYRGLEYTVLSQKRSSIKIDKEELKQLIKEKENQLSELKEEITQFEKLKSVEEEIEQTKKLDKTEAEIEYLKSQVNDYSDVLNSGIAFKIIGLGTSFKKDDTSDSSSVTLIGLGGEYDTALWKKISFKTSLTYFFGREDAKLNDRGTPNTQSITEFHSHKGVDFSAALPITFGRFRFSPTAGLLMISYKSSQYNYNNFGIGLNKVEKKYNYNTGYVGLGVRYGGKLFIEVEPRQYFKDKKSNLGLSLGVRFNF